MTHAFAWFLSLVAARSALILLFLVFGLRLVGKRQVGQMNVYDLVLIMALANAVQNAMTSGKGDLTVGLVSAGTLVLMGRLLTSLFVRAPKLEARLIGSPTVLIHDGRIEQEHLRRECVTEQQLMTILREHGLTDPAQVLMAVLEVDGSISIVPKDAKHRRTKKRVP